MVCIIFSVRDVRARVHTAWASVLLVRIYRQYQSLEERNSNSAVPLLFIYICVMAIHIGKSIEKVLREQGRSVSWFAKQICCERTNVYSIFNRDSIDTGLLMRISIVLSHDFFKEYREQLDTYHSAIDK